MAVRPPRALRRRGDYRDQIQVAIAAALLVLFGLRAVLAMLNVATWTLGWRLVALPTALPVRVVERAAFLDRAIVGRFTFAEALVTVIAGIVALWLLAALTVRRAPWRP